MKKYILLLGILGLFLSAGIVYAALPGSEWGTDSRVIPANRTAGSLIDFENRLVFIGGSDGAAAQTTVYVSSDLGQNWATTTALSTAVSFSDALVWNGKLCVFMGFNAAGSEIDDVQCLSTVGGPWTTYSASYPSDLVGHCVVDFNDLIVVVGGDDGSGPSTKIYSAAAPEGPWTLQATMSEGRKYMGCAVVDDILYIVGGTDTLGGTKATVFTLDTSWSLSSVEDYPTDVQLVEAYNWNGKLYSCQGYDGTANLTECNRFAGNSWVFVGDTPAALRESAGAVHKGRLLLVAGNDGSSIVDDIYYSLGVAGQTEPVISSPFTPVSIPTSTKLDVGTTTWSLIPGSAAMISGGSEIGFSEELSVKLGYITLYIGLLMVASIVAVTTRSMFILPITGLILLMGFTVVGMYFGPVAGAAISLSSVLFLSLWIPKGTQVA